MSIAMVVSPDAGGYPLLRPHAPVGVPLSVVAASLGLPVVGTGGDIRCTGITVAADDVRAGDVFAGMPGQALHGAQFARRAADRGAVALLTDDEGAHLARGSGLPVIITSSPRRVLGAAASTIYGTARASGSARGTHPMRHFGVTGTNGKTSTVHILQSLLRQLGIPCGLSSTIERRTAAESVPSRLTTPEASELHALVARMIETGARSTAIEVSAQAMSGHRVDGLEFDVVGFTNLTHDHLDEYGSLDEYARAKMALFQPEHARRGVVSLDSPWGATVVARAGIPITTISSTGDADAHWNVTILDEQPDATAFELRSRDGHALTTTVDLLGRHMAANAALAIVMALDSGIPFDHLRDAVGSGLHAEVPGRAAAVDAPNGPRIFVDIAHTPDAFAATLSAVRSITPGKLLMVMGADGDRDRSKRAEMGRVSAEGCEVLIVTDHHARFEDAAQIRAELLGGAALATKGARVHEVADPARAIRRAVALADEGDSILWAGPGLTPYRDVRGERVLYSSFQDARVALREAGWG